MTLGRIVCWILAGILAAPTFFASIIAMFWIDGKIWGGSGGRESMERPKEASFAKMHAVQVKREYAFIRQGLIDFIDVPDGHRDEAEEAFIRRVTIDAINARKAQRGDARESFLRHKPIDYGITSAQREAEYAVIERELIDILGVSRDRQDAAKEAFVRKALIKAIESLRAQ